MKFTINDILALRPCETYDQEYLNDLWEGKESLSRKEILQLNIPIEDLCWVLARLVPSRTKLTDWATFCFNIIKNSFKEEHLDAGKNYIDLLEKPQLTDNVAACNAATIAVHSVNTTGRIDYYLLKHRIIRLLEHLIYLCEH